MGSPMYAHKEVFIFLYPFLCYRDHFCLGDGFPCALKRVLVQCKQLVHQSSHLFSQVPFDQGESALKLASLFSFHISDG